MRLLIDEMHHPAITTTLGDEGWDIISALDPGLRGRTDEELLALATAEERSPVTENVADFTVVASRWASAARSHCGIVFTAPRRFSRASLAYPGDAIAALRQLLLDDPDLTDTIWWV